VNKDLYTVKSKSITSYIYIYIQYTHTATTHLAGGRGMNRHNRAFIKRHRRETISAVGDVAFAPLIALVQPTGVVIILIIIAANA